MLYTCAHTLHMCLCDVTKSCDATNCFSTLFVTVRRKLFDAGCFSGAFRCLIEEKLLSGHAFMKLRLPEAAEL